ncbi:hypothetical protein [Limnochorda pilosa]|uniref:Uncharacterized protein n=1 Tax=Limnochorda pilosa TaxID=1555112 RepID=A0A0K2SGA6_LIMPI|nr:hypothetical protein [Limnochorda pilosa]BAS26136.1 hypothetical protein LIP_0279 [Limnochorda pilosa]
MAERTLDLRPRIGAHHLRQIEEEVNRLGPDDRLVLVMEREDAHETRPIAELLYRKGVGWQPKGGHGSLHTITIGPGLTRPLGPDPDDPPANAEDRRGEQPAPGL